MRDVAGDALQLGPLRDAANAEVIGCVSSAGLVAILACCLAMYGAVSFQTEAPLATKTLSGRETAADALQTAEGRVPHLRTPPRYAPSPRSDSPSLPAREPASNW
jgi:hypothetical protein